MAIKSSRIFKLIALALCFSLVFEQSGFAQVAGELDLSAHFTRLSSVFTQDKFRPLHLRYISYDNQNNNFKLLLDKGSSVIASPEGAKQSLDQDKLKAETKTLLNYFFTGISLPNSSFWVNLRPDQADNIIDPEVEKTDLGRILLAADLQLKKDTANFTSPQTPEGKEYWDKLYKRAGELYGSENITIPTLTRPWIVPGEIIIRETPDNAYIYKATLKVMLEEDYVRSSTSTLASTYSFKDARSKALNEYSSQLIRELIIPKLVKDVNTAKRYAPLRQVYYSLILAQWFKQKFYGKGGLYSYLIDKKNLTGLASLEPWSKTSYFQAYQKSFSEGEYNIKEQAYSLGAQSIRSYMSGGIAFGIENNIAKAIEASEGKIAGSPLRSISSLNFKGIPGEFRGATQNPFSGEVNFGRIPQSQSIIEEKTAGSSPIEQPGSPAISKIQKTATVGLAALMLSGISGFTQDLSAKLTLARAQNIAKIYAGNQRTNQIIEKHIASLHKTNVPGIEFLTEEFLKSLLSVETDGRKFGKDGQPIQSKAGARGIGQVKENAFNGVRNLAATLRKLKSEGKLYGNDRYKLAIFDALDINNKITYQQAILDEDTHIRVILAIAGEHFIYFFNNKANRKGFPRTPDDIALVMAYMAGAYNKGDTEAIARLIKSFSKYYFLKQLPKKFLKNNPWALENQRQAETMYRDFKEMVKLAQGKIPVGGEVFAWTDNFLYYKLKVRAQDNRHETVVYAIDLSKGSDPQLGVKIIGVSKESGLMYMRLPDNKILVVKLKSASSSIQQRVSGSSPVGDSRILIEVDAPQLIKSLLKNSQIYEGLIALHINQVGRTVGEDRGTLAESGVRFEDGTPVTTYRLSLSDDAEISALIHEVLHAIWRNNANLQGYWSMHNGFNLKTRDRGNLSDELRLEESFCDFVEWVLTGVIDERIESSEQAKKFAWDVFGLNPVLGRLQKEYLALRSVNADKSSGLSASPSFLTTSYIDRFGAGSSPVDKTDSASAAIFRKLMKQVRKDTQGPLLKGQVNQGGALCLAHAIALKKALNQQGAAAEIYVTPEEWWHLGGNSIVHFWVETDNYILDVFPEGLGPFRRNALPDQDAEDVVIADKSKRAEFPVYVSGQKAADTIWRRAIEFSGSSPVREDKTIAAKVIKQLNDQRSLLANRQVPLVAELQDRFPGTVKDSDVINKLKSDELSALFGASGESIKKEGRIIEPPGIKIPEQGHLEEWLNKIEEPARNLVRNIINFGGVTFSSNAYGPGFLGVSWEKDKVLYLTPLGEEDYGIDSGSSPMGYSDKGGIDLRALPIATQQMPASIVAPSAMRLAPIPLAQLQNEWKQIENMISAGIVPSTDRIKDYLAACCASSSMSQATDKVLSCLADIMRIEEERVESTEPALKAMLSLLESDKPAHEMRLALAKITVSAKEPKAIPE